MARPTKWRKIEYVPGIPYFVPSEREMPEVPVTILKLEELEAIRLKDLEGLEQEECALRMEVSRPTFQRILLSAREKIADSLINSKSIKIGGGNFTRFICPIQCEDCGKEWKDSIENLEQVKNGSYVCPDCGSNNVICTETCSEKVCGRNGCCRRRRLNQD